MTPENLKQYFLNWRKNRLDKLAPEVIVEFKQHPERFNALHHLAITEDDYPFQEYGSWLAGHIIEQYYASEHIEKINEVIDAYLSSSNHSVKRNLQKIINQVKVDYRSGELIDRAFHNLCAADEAVGLRSYSFHYLMLWLKDFPDLRSEIDLIVEQFPELFRSGAMQSCLKKYAGLKKR